MRQLASHAGRPLAVLQASQDEAWAVERGLQLCAQNVLDIATHLAAAAGRDAPDYAAAIDALGEIGALPRAFAATLRAVAGFRNVLVHGYLGVDLALLHAALNGRLGDFTEFARHVEAYLELG
ncbi:MAG: type VII toxin-antitoxin system HepT family RNase toxin [Deltaproteobacteria bacterium]